MSEHKDWLRDEPSHVAKDDASELSHAAEDDATPADEPSPEALADASLESPTPAVGGVMVYRVTAPMKIFGHEPGAIFSAAIEPAHERRLIERGQLERYASSGRPARPAGATAPDTRPQEAEE